MNKVSWSLRRLLIDCEHKADGKAENIVVSFFIYWLATNLSLLTCAVVGSGKLGDEAVQALSTKEDMSKVVLRHHDNKASPVPGISLHWLPYTDLMLIQVKGQQTIDLDMVTVCCTSLTLKWTICITWMHLLMQVADPAKCD